MQYSLVIFEGPESVAIRQDPQKAPAYMGAWGAYAKALAEAGVMRGGAGLQLANTATTVWITGGSPDIHDGPYADAKEQLGGFFIIEVSDLDAALQWAARCPALPGSAIEVRPNLTQP